MAIDIQTVAFPSITGLGAGPLNDIRFSKSQTWVAVCHPVAGIRLFKKNAAGDDYNTAGIITIASVVAGNCFDAAFSDDELTLYYAVGANVYYATLSGGVWTHQGTVVAHGGTVRGVSVSPARAHIAIAGTASFQIRSISGTSYISVAATNVEEVSFSPSGEFCVIATRAAAVRVYQWNGTTYVLLTVTGSATNAGNWQVAWRPDGKQFIVAEYLNTTGVYPYNLTGSNTWTLQSSIFAQQTIGACYFAEGKYAIAQSGTGSTRQLWSMSGFTFTPDTATFTMGSTTQLRSSEDGKGITFAGALASSPYLAMFKSPTKITSTSALTAPKPVTGGQIKVSLAANGALKAPKATLAGSITVPFVSSVAVNAPKATALGSLAIAGVETPIEEHIGVRTAVLMVENSTYNWFEQTADKGALYGVLTAPKPKFAAYGTQGRLVFSTLTAPKAKTNSLLSNPYFFEGVMAAGLPDMSGQVAHLYLTAPLLAPKVKLDADVNVPFRHVTGALSAPKAEVAGNIVLRVRVSGSVKAPKPIVAGQIGNLYVTGILTAPKAKTGGVVGNPYKVTGVLKARLPVTNATVIQPYKIQGTLGSLLPTAEGYLAIADVVINGVMQAPKAKLDGSITVPTAVVASLTAPKAKVAGTLLMELGIVGTLTAPRPKFTGLVLRYIRADALLKAPKAKLAGQLAYLLKFTGTVSAPKAKIAGQLSMGYRAYGEIVAPKPLLEGTFKQTIYVEGDVSAPMPLLEGFVGVEGEMLGELTAPVATLTGDIDVATAFFGDLTAPSAVVAGEFELLVGIRADLTAPAATADGLLDLRYLIEGIGAAPLPQIEANITLRYDVTSDLYAPTPTVDGILRATYNVTGDLSAPPAVLDGVFALFYPVDLDGELTAPRAVTDGLLNNIDSRLRRHLTVIRR